MPQWVELPPNLVPSAQTNGKSIYATDYSSKRPGFQIHLQKAARGARTFHHPRVPKDPSRSSLRASQTASYLSFKDEYDKKLAEKTGRSVSSLRKTPTPTPDTKDSEVKREVLSEFIKPSLDLVHQAWKTEKTAVNRDRERMYGLAAKKVDFAPKPPPKAQASKKATERTLPGMKNWLKKSNEYEKAVVCNFMDHIAKATVTKETPHPRPKTPQPSSTHFPNEYFYKQRAKSAQSQRVTQRVDVPPRPKTVHSFRNEATEVSHGNQEESSTQHTHSNHVHHTEGKCEFCDYLRVKQLLEYLNSHDSQLGEATLRHLLRPRVDPTYGYPSYEDYDYIHDNSFFSYTTARDRGYFIIAPDWVSERKGIMPPKYRA